MTYLGPFCQSAGITTALLEESDKGKLPELGVISNGLALELKQFTDNKSYTIQRYISILTQIDSNFGSVVNLSSVTSKINTVKEQKKKLVSKKKVKGVKNLKELLEKQFSAPVQRINNNDTQIEKEVFENVPKKDESEQEIQTTKFVEKMSQTDDPCDIECSSNSRKIVNVLKYKQNVLEKKNNSLTTKLHVKRDLLNKVEGTLGHYSAKNVNKRDETAKKNLHKLRDTQRLNIRLEKTNYANKNTIDINKKSEKELKHRIALLGKENENLKECMNKIEIQIQNEKDKKLVAQKANSYLRSEISELRDNLKSLGSDTSHDDCNSNLIKVKLASEEKDIELAERDRLIQELQETISDLTSETIKTKNEKGVFNENVRLSVMELAGLEVAVDKMSLVIQTVLKHLCGKTLRKDQLPNPATTQAIVDEGHYITKTYIADRLEKCENWGLSRDGTTRRKQKILDTSATLDTGDIISLGFTRVAQETAKTIQAVTQDHLTELSTMNGHSAYLTETLNKLSFTMSDRASNEKLADKLLDEWRDTMLNEYEGDKSEVLHYHCMAHVLLGFHNYVTPEIKEFEQQLKNETGPLGRDTLSVFNTWSKKETVVSRVVRTTSDTFGPAGDHIGLRDRWEAYCSQNGLKSIIGNYRDNRFNALFQTAAEVYLHRDDFLTVLNTVSKPNLKLTAVKSDLESSQVCALLQALGLFYVKVTGPYWNLITSDKLTYLGLDKDVGEIEQFLTKCETSPETLLLREFHWSTSDPLEIAQVPHHARLVEALFDINSESRDLIVNVIPIIASAMLKCIRKQLVDFLPGGQFYQTSADPKPSTFAPLTNLGCEHHFGDLDSSQRRRPNASFHHHTSIQLLKRNRKQVMEWISDMDSEKKEKLMVSARKEGVKLRDKHKENDKTVLKSIHENMMEEKSNKGKKRKAKSQQSQSPKKSKKGSDLPVISAITLNTYVAVAYQDDWYPGIVENVINDNEVLINFMLPCKQKGYYQWPLRQDKQIVEKQFITKQNFVPDCVSSGRQWFISENNFQPISCHLFQLNV